MKMKIANDRFQVETVLSEQKVEELLKENLSERMLALQYSGRDGFVGRLKPETKEFKFAFLYRKAKCAVVTGYYAAEGERGTTVHFDIRWPMFEVLSFILGALASAIVPFIFSKYYFVLPMHILIGWPLVAVAFCAGTIGYYYIPGIKRARTRLLDLFEANVRSVIED